MQELETCERGSSNFIEIFEGLKDIAEEGFYDACEIVAELQALEACVYDAEAAYIWYYIALKHQGYNTVLQNEGTELNYLGPVGDFRNEAIVSSLVEKLEVSKLANLDSKAEQWIRTHHG